MSRLTRDGTTTETVSRDQILRHEQRGQGNIHFPCSADHEQDWQPYAVDPYSCYMCDHTIHDSLGMNIYVAVIFSDKGQKETGCANQSINQKLSEHETLLCVQGRMHVDKVATMLVQMMAESNPGRHSIFYHQTTYVRSGCVQIFLSTEYSSRLSLHLGWSY